ncbi:hypothetical protein D3C73_1509250 [compost metagenome]
MKSSHRVRPLNAVTSLVFDLDCLVVASIQMRPSYFSIFCTLNVVNGLFRLVPRLQGYSRGEQDTSFSERRHVNLRSRQK